MTPDKQTADPLDALIALVQALRATRRLDSPTEARARLTALRAASATVAAENGRGQAWLLIDAVADEQEHVVQQLEARAAERKAAEEKRQAEAMARVAAESDGAAVELDGGPSTLGVADWLAHVEAWGGERDR